MHPTSDADALAAGGPTPEPARPGSPAPGGEVPSTGSRNAKIGFGIFVLLNVAVLGYFALAGGDDERGPDQQGTDPVITAPEVTVAPTAPGDAFNRAGAVDGLGAGPGFYRWQVEGGTWTIIEGQAAATGHEGFATFATVDGGTGDGTAEVKVRKLYDGAGLVFRYEDPDNFWAVLAVPDYSNWHVLRVVDGDGALEPVEIILGPTADDTRVAVRASGDRIEVIINGEVKATIDDGALADATRWGIAMKGPDTQSARFDDFVFATEDGSTPTTATEDEPAEDDDDEPEGGAGDSTSTSAVEGSSTTSP
jgi:hypothetical protein